MLLQKKENKTSLLQTSKSNVVEPIEVKYGHKVSNKIKCQLIHYS